MDTWVETGSHVTPYYDSLLAKLMVFAPTRAEAIAKLVDALSKTKVEPPVWDQQLIGVPSRWTCVQVVYSGNCWP